MCQLIITKRAKVQLTKITDINYGVIGPFPSAREERTNFPVHAAAAAAQTRYGEASKQHHHRLDGVTLRSLWITVQHKYIGTVGSRFTAIHFYYRRRVSVQ
jgi:hypothetical protein